MRKRNGVKSSPSMRKKHTRKPLAEQYAFRRPVTVDRHRTIGYPPPLSSFMENSPFDVRDSSSFTPSQAPFPGMLPGHSGAKGERPGRYCDCGPADFTWTQSDAGVLVAHSAVVLFLRRDVRGDGLPHEVHSPQCRGSQHWPPHLLHPR